MTIYQHLGIFSDLVDEAHRQGPLYPLAVPGTATQRKVRDILGFCHGPETPLDVRVEQTWERDGLSGERITWTVGYGPRTEAYLLKPAGTTTPLPGIVALHDHGGFKFFGKEKIADGPADTPQVLVDYRNGGYGGRAFANALAKEGFVVLITTHDVRLLTKLHCTVYLMEHGTIVEQADSKELLDNPDKFVNLRLFVQGQN